MGFPKNTCPATAAIANELIMTAKPSKDCQIAAQAASIFLASPAAFINPNPAVIILKNAKMPAAVKKRRRTLLRSMISPPPGAVPPHVKGFLIVPKGLSEFVVPPPPLLTHIRVQPTSLHS